MSATAVASYMTSAAMTSAAVTMGSQSSCRHRHTTESNRGSERDECFMKHVSLLS
jgi:hypothetical protein